MTRRCSTRRSWQTCQRGHDSSHACGACSTAGTRASLRSTSTIARRMVWRPQPSIQSPIFPSIPAHSHGLLPSSTRSCLQGDCLFTSQRAGSERPHSKSSPNAAARTTSRRVNGLSAARHSDTALRARRSARRMRRRRLDAGWAARAGSSRRPGASPGT